MGAAAIPLIIAGVGMKGGASLMQFQSARAASEVQRSEAETAASEEELGATQREADRKQRLAAALASQSAMAGAGGIAAFEGSPLAILEADIGTEKEATQRDIYQTKLKAESIRSSAAIRERMMKQQAVYGLLGDIGSTAMQAGIGAKTQTPAKK